MLTTYFHSGREQIVLQLIMPYLVMNYDWSKADATKVVMSIFILYFLIRFFSIFIIGNVPIKYYLYFNIITGLYSIIFLSFSDHSNKIFIWLSIGFSAISTSSTFTMLLLWSRSFVKTDSIFTSIFTIGTNLGFASIVPLTTYLFENFGLKWFSYMVNVCFILWILNIAFILKFGKEINSESHVETPIHCDSQIDVCIYRNCTLKNSTNPQSQATLSS